MKQKRLPIGKSDFRNVILDNCYYIDKSLFIREITESWADVMLIPRPRRFGKTLNLSMLRYFYEKSGEDRSCLFDGLAIRDDGIFGKHQGKYPVIYLTFKDIKDRSWESMYQHIINILRDEFLRHEVLLKTDILSPTEKEYFESVLNRKSDYADYADSLRYLSLYLNRFHDKRVIILIDEYDTPLHAGYAHDFYEEVISFMRNFLSGGFKDNGHLFKGVLTGILRVAKESVFSGLNNLGVYTLLDKEFDSAFGFTEDEVRDLLSYYGISEHYDEISRWYDGYLFGGKVIYNPWSLFGYVASKSKEFRPYWVNTAGTEMIDRLVTREGRELREEIGVLLEGGTLTKPIYESIVMKDLETRDDLLWSFLLFSGYLKSTGQAVRRNLYELKIPNREVLIIYEEMIIRWFGEKTESNQLEEMLKALETGNTELFERMLRIIVRQVMSYHDFSGEPEKVYHALVLGMLVWLRGKYDIRSNRESGYGRYDVMLKPKDLTKQGIIIEFKRVFEDEGDTPEQVLESALKQIEIKEYATELESAGIKDILKLAVAFRGKELWVRQSES